MEELGHLVRQTFARFLEQKHGYEYNLSLIGGVAAVGLFIDPPAGAGSHPPLKT